MTDTIPDVDRLQRWWLPRSEAFAARGYHIYKLNDYGIAFPDPIPEIRSHYNPFPYAHVGPCKIVIEPLQYLGSLGSILVYHARTTKGHHVTLKWIPIDSDEYRILKFMHENPSTEEKFNHIMPVLDIIHGMHEDHCVIVMPRWDEVRYAPWVDQYFYTPSTILDYLEAALRALSYLHENRIIHRDLVSRHMLQNQLWDSWNNIRYLKSIRDKPQFWKRNEMTRQLRTSGKMLYALIDFSLAKRLDPGCDRLPYEESYLGPSYEYHPRDTAHGEYDYDPFAYDVAMLGNTFCRTFQHNIPSIPLLAPLFDGMINPRIERRFTAKQALDFLIARRAEMSSSELSADLPDATKYVDNQDNLGDTYDRWVGLPEEFVKKWAPLYKVRYPSMWTLFLRRICSDERVYRVVAWIRRQWDCVFRRNGIRLT